MKNRILLTLITLALMLSAFGQKPTLELTFTAIDSAAFFQLDSIKVMNRTQGGDTTLYWPDTVLDYQMGIPDINRDVRSLQLFQNYPNPVTDQTTISLFVPEKDIVNMIVTDMLGRVILKSDRMLDRGIHSFRFTPGGGNLYFFTAQWRGNSGSIKILQATSNSHGASLLEYTGSEPSFPQLKATEDVQGFSFNLGDELLYIGYGNTLQSGMLDAPETSETYTFQFATNIPCLGMSTIEYEGMVYNTIQIFSQCWLKENLNAGTMIDGNDDMENNSIVEKYCYENEPDSCNKYGGLYQWDEMMKYTTQLGAQGICPQGWHLPTDEEWKVLQGAVDSHYGIGSDEWDDVDFRGFDAGLNLKATSGWNYNGNGTDLFGFTCLPGGIRINFLNNFTDIGSYGVWWTSTNHHIEYAWLRVIDWDHQEVYRGTDFYHSYYRKIYGFSVRCVRDY